MLVFNRVVKFKVFGVKNGGARERIGEFPFVHGRIDDLLDAAKDEGRRIGNVFAIVERFVKFLDKVFNREVLGLVVARFAWDC